METVQKKWQTKCTSISQRTKFIFNTALLSDVNFIFSVSNGESERKVIPAHKLILAMGSPKFSDRFCGPTSDTEDSIEVSEYDYESILELFRFIYCDDVNLTRSNVLNVLYLANEHSVPSLAEKCDEFLRKNLDPTNVLAILPHARMSKDEDLQDRCWKVIEMYTEEVVNSDKFLEAERLLVESIVKRMNSNLEEVELFKGVNRWAEKKITEKGKVADGNVKREIIGEEILKAIRFPVMSQGDFSNFVLKTNILNKQEVLEMRKYYSGKPTPSLPYLQSPRIPVLKRASRFKGFKKPPMPSGGALKLSANMHSLVLSVDKAIYLKGIQHFGSDGCYYDVWMVIQDTTRNQQGYLNVKSGSYSSEEDSDGIYYGFNVFFDTPVILQPGKRYKIISWIKGPASSWYGEQGQTLVNFDGINLTISESDIPAHNKETSTTHGQFPVFYFSQHSG